MKPNAQCVICTKPMYRIPCRINGYNTCSIGCRNKWFSKDKHPKWRGGVRDVKKDRARDKARRLEYKQKAVALLGGACVDCGFNGCIAAFQFHHLDPLQKDVQIRDLIVRKWEVIEKELQKCVLLCANCHFTRHWREHHET